MKKRVLPILFCILLLLTVALPVFAADDGSITVLFRHEGQAVTGATFQIYKAADWDGSDYSLIAPFSDYSVSLSDDPNSEEWKALATTLAAYVARDGIQPLATAAIDETGQLRFDGLSDGLYLVTGSIATLDDLLIFPQPMLVSVPYAKDDGTLDREIVTEPKYESRGPEKDTVTRHVLKIWKDEGYEDKRPHLITVQLLCNGEVYDEQTLSEENNWGYTWTGLDAACDWQLTEKEVPENFTVTVTRESMTFLVTNTDHTPPPPPPPGLPQTGLLWWPVPVLLAFGALALCGGIFLLLRKKG